MDHDQPERSRSLLGFLRPDEGWISLGLVLLLAFVMSWSLADARWVLGRDQATSYLVWIGVIAALWGYLSARLEMSPWVAHLFGAVIGAFVIIECVGSTLPNAEPGLVGWFTATAHSVTEAYLDLTWRHQLTTLQYGHYGLVLGILVWGTAQAASYDIFGYRRAVNGVLLLGVVLVANMSLTLQDQFGALVVFSIGALMLLLLTHAADERASWIRHRIWRGKETETPHLRGGVAFASIAVCVALVLTTIASSAPLRPVMEDFGNNFHDVAVWLSGYLPGGGNPRIPGSADFGSSSVIASSFNAPNTPVFTVRVPDDQTSFHWRMVAYDRFEKLSWSVSDTKEAGLKPLASLTGGTQDQVSSTARKQATIVVHIQDRSIKHLVVANEPFNVNVSTKRAVVGSGSTTNVAWFTTNEGDYTLHILMPDLNTSGAGLTEWRLRHAGSEYPTGLLARYTQGTDQIGADGRALLEEIKAWAPTQNLSFDNEYNVAKAIQSYLSSSEHFLYKTNITDVVSNCSGLSMVDCFAIYRQGFCQQYATTMTMLMRLAGYPARYVVGYLPGLLDPHTMIEQITRQQQHAWVEVYFPTYGWITFDPTGGSIGQQAFLPAGSAVSASPIPSLGSFEPNGTFAGPSVSARPEESEEPGAAGGSSGSGLPLLPIAAGVALVGLAALWWLRPKRLEEPQVVYRRIVRLASRLGYRPHPTQTVYEYTGMLAEVAPRARDPLGVVATATVEVTYGKRRMETERLSTLAAAYEQIRRALLRLPFRLPRRKARGRQGSQRR
jgi:hypothetical protein